MKEMVTLSQTELKRMLVLQRVLEGQISTFEAALVLSLSERQVYRQSSAGSRSSRETPLKIV
ncbi:hypothetical protein [Desulfofundulus salinus]|uniref:hypothetical protein n=1 Tax=Desulfofundulus salinus TaxID=2419843 RepID=UPI001A9A8B6C|nr:hypothetical protein [Desulfofundulus salinum]